MQQLETDFKRTIDWDKYQSEPTLNTRNRYLNYLIDPSFQVAKRLFILSFENDAHQISHKRFFLPTAKIEDYNVLIDGKTYLISQ